VPNERERLDWATERAARVSLAATVVVVAVKLAAAGVSGSVSVLSEALQSLLDVALSAATVWAVRVTAAPPDEEHPYGHGKAEVLLSAFQMVVVVFTAGVIAWQAALRLRSPVEIRVDAGVAAMVYAVASNLVVMGHLRSAARRTGSVALLGEVEHLRGDTFASLGVLGGLIAVHTTGWLWLDPVVALAFTALGALYAVRRLRILVHPLMDGSLPPDEMALIKRVLESHPETRGYHDLLTRQAGRLRVVSLHVMLDDHLSFVQAHDLAEQIESEIRNALGGALVTVHYEPYEAETAHRAREHEGPGRS
jgi:cation diffusion facilitator family transporter